MAGGVATADPARSRATRRQAGGWRSVLALIAGLSAASFASYLVAVAAFDTFELAGLRHGAVISLLLGLALGLQLAGPGWLERDLAELAPLLPESHRVASTGAVAATAPLARRAVIALGGALGFVVVVASTEGEVLRPPLEASSTWGVVANVLLFGLMARVGWLQQVEERFLDREVTRHLRVPLLARERLSAYARRGLRGSLFWFVGSSLASVLIFNWGFSLVTLVVVLCTLGLGTFALLDPSRRLRRRLQQAKREELGRVRDAIEAARRDALSPGGGEAAARLPGLLAWEARVEAVAEWPFDVSTWLRFGALALLAVGSWLGGALVERVLGLALD